MTATLRNRADLGSEGLASFVARADRLSASLWRIRRGTPIAGYREFLAESADMLSEIALDVADFYRARPQLSPGDILSLADSGSSPGEMATRQARAVELFNNLADRLRAVIENPSDLGSVEWLAGAFDAISQTAVSVHNKTTAVE